MKKGYIIAAAILALLIIVGGITVMNRDRSVPERNLDAAGEELIDYFEIYNEIQIRDIAVSAEGNVKPQDDTEEYAYICIEIDKKDIKVMKQRFKEAGIRECEYDDDEENGVWLPAAFTHELAERIHGEKVVAWYQIFHSGQIAMTRDVHFYITKDSSGRAYVYMFG